MASQVAPASRGERRRQCRYSVLRCWNRLSTPWAVVTWRSVTRALGGPWCAQAITASIFPRSPHRGQPDVACEMRNHTISRPGCPSRRHGRLVELLLPIGRYSSGGTRDGLVERMVVRRYELGTEEGLLGRVVPEPVLSRLEAVDDRMPLLVGVATGVLGR
jgi:hypothetical protein